MYVCVCKAVSERQVREAIDEGTASRKDLALCLGVGTECGKCNKHVKEIIAESKQTTPVEPVFGQSDWVAA